MSPLGLSLVEIQEVVPGLSSANIETLEPLLLRLDRALTLRTYLSGYHIGHLDEEAWTALRINKMTSGFIRQRRMPVNVSRWFTYIDAMHPEIQDDVKAAEARAREHRAAASRAGANYNIGLTDTQHGVVTRFPPEPS